MADIVIRTMQTPDRRAVCYSVLRDGVRLWSKTVAFGPNCPPAGADFVRAAQEQERFAYGLLPPPISEPQYVTHAKAAAQIGVTKETIYRWEKLGLIAPALRNRNGWRLFTPEMIERIKSFKNAGILS